MSKKLSFPRFCYEFIDKIQLSDEEREYYAKFQDEYYSNSLSKDNLENQLHNSEELVDQVYQQTNSRNRDLYSHKKAVNVLETYEDTTDLPKITEQGYLETLKVKGLNGTLLTIFSDYTALLSVNRAPHRILSILKSFYIEVFRLNREEKKWRRNNRKV